MDKYARAIESSYMQTKHGQESAKNYVASNLPEYHLHPHLSDNNSTVLHNQNTNEVIIAYRGTVHPQENFYESMKDYAADAQVALGLHKIIQTPRLHEAQTKFDRVKALYPDASIKVAGHSLGGVESYYVATNNDIEGHHFNVFETPVAGIPLAQRGYKIRKTKYLSR